MRSAYIVVADDTDGDGQLILGVYSSLDRARVACAEVDEYACPSILVARLNESIQPEDCIDLGGRR